MPKMVNIRALLGLTAFFWTLPCLFLSPLALLSLIWNLLRLIEPFWAFLGLIWALLCLTYRAVLGLTGPYWAIPTLAVLQFWVIMRSFRPNGLQWPKNTIFGQKPHPMAQNHHLHL